MASHGFSPPTFPSFFPGETAARFAFATPEQQKEARDLAAGGWKRRQGTIFSNLGPNVYIPSGYVNIAIENGHL